MIFLLLGAEYITGSIAFSIIVLSPLAPVFNSIAFFAKCIIASFENFALQVVYEKAGEKWWSCLIPIYNVYILNKIVFRNGWMFTIIFITPLLSILATFAGAAELTGILGLVGILVTFIYAIMLMYKLGTRFGMNGILMILFSPITIPMIAFVQKYKYYAK